MVRNSARFPAILFFVAAISICPAIFADASESAGARFPLQDGWQIESGCRVQATGAQISTAGFRADGWHPAAVPETVLAALVADGTYPDLYFGENLRSIPGTSYAIGKNFSVLPMPADSPFRCSWWYRAEFRLPAEYRGRHVWLDFGGINYRANIWLNGRKIADAADVAGAYRTYEFDVTPYARADGPNALAVETFAQTENDLGINWVDWNPAPPDKDMGLWREVYVRASGAIAVRHPQVIAHFADSSLAHADLTVEAELRNATRKRATGLLEGSIENISFRQRVALGPGETRTIRFAPERFPQLRIQNPKLWWPWQMGKPNLHELSLRALAGGELSDSETIRFGIREITSSLDERGHRLFRVNGKKILIRGGGWAPDMLSRQSPERLNTEFRYIRDMSLNAVRMEGKLESDDFYSLADQQGILILAGWCCCDHWEQWAKWKPGDLAIATASLRSQILRMRAHPSMLAWLNGSDNPPPANVEKAYIAVLKQSDWSNPYLSSASEKATVVTGASGVKMTGPYDYVPPDYWLADAGKFGGAYGFNTETSPGPAVPPLGSLEKFLPVDHLHPDDPVWNYHAGSGAFGNLRHFEEAMNAIYGAPSDFADYERKAQAMAYDGERAMFEAYSQNKYGSTGVIQWMLNNAWPSLIWHLYDYYLQPAGGYFGAKKACEPLHAQYSYADHTVAVVNSTYHDAAGLTVTAKLYDGSMQERFSRQVTASVEADGVAKIFAIPASAFTQDSSIYFLRLSVDDSSGQPISRNFYWLSAKKSIYDWDKTTYRYTPVSSYEDLSALDALAPAGPMKISASVEKAAEGPLVRVKIENEGTSLAFQIHLGIHLKDSEMEILPVLWSDNYIELMPGESREITAQFTAPDELEQPAVLTVEGWNLPRMGTNLPTPRN